MNCEVFFQIPSVGLEPTRLAATDFESVVSAIPPTRQNKVKKNRFLRLNKIWRRQPDLNR